MKKIILLSLPVLFLAVGWLSSFFSKPDEAPQMVCCDPATEATARFASLADDQAFVAKHENPEKINFQSTLGEMITFEAADGEEASAYLVKGQEGSNQYILMIHEWWGLNDHIKQEAERYQKALGDVHVLALDLYDGKVADTREKAGEYMQGADPERLQAIIQGAIDYAGADATFGTIGWCFGGGWSLQSAIIAEDQAKACIIYYGMPEKDQDRLQQLEAKVLGIFAKKDGWITPEVAKEFEDNLEAIGKDPIIKIYDADHAFANPSNPKYNEQYAEETFALSVDFLKENL